MSYYDEENNEEALRFADNLFLWTVVSLALALLIVFVLSYVFDPLRADAQTKQRVMVIGGCDESLWKHTYNPQRLEVHERCVSVTGTIVDATHGKRKDGVRKEADGDCHGWLKLDAGQDGEQPKSGDTSPRYVNLEQKDTVIGPYLNPGNMSDEEGNLVFEIVCMFPVTQKDAINACKNYKNKVKLPAVGSHVRMTGSFVQDDNHAKWNELHPVSSI